MTALTVRVGATWSPSGAPVGGRWLHGLVPFGNLEFSTTFQRPGDQAGGGGTLTVSLSMALSGSRPLPSQIRTGSLVEVYAGPIPVATGFVSETPAGNTVTADGLYRLGEHFLALNASGGPTTDVSVAVAQAIARGLRWRNPGTLPTGAVSTLSEGAARFNTVSAVLNAYCRLNGKFWYIDRYHVLQIVDLPTAASWSLSPNVPNPQTADDDYVSAFYIRRVDGVDTDGQPNAWAVDSATDAMAPMVRETGEDLEQFGYMNAAQGEAAAAAYLNANKARAGFVEGVSLVRGQIANLGGVAPELWAVRAGQVVRQANWLTAAGDLMVGRRQSWVVGGTTWRQGEPLTVTPLGLAPRTTAAVVQDAAGNKELVFS